MNERRDPHDMDGDRLEQLAFVRLSDPEGADRLERLLKKKHDLASGNVYGERFTERQFALVFDPLLTCAVERAKILEALLDGEASVPELAARLGIATEAIFNHMRELSRRDLTEITGYKERDALFRRKA